MVWFDLIEAADTIFVQPEVNSLPPLLQKRSPAPCMQAGTDKDGERYDEPNDRCNGPPRDLPVIGTITPVMLCPHSNFRAELV